MTDNISAPRRGRPRRSLFKPSQHTTVLTEEADEVLDAVSARDSAPPPAPKLAPKVEAEAPARPVRQNPKDEDPRTRAARRAAEIRGHNNGNMDDGTDEFWIDPSSIPDGWSYEWKTQTVVGMDLTAYQTNLRRKGWEPVEASRHPELMPRDSTGAEITRKGMILMERPLELTEEAQQIERRRARQQVTNKNEQLNATKPGEFERSNKDSSLVKVKRGYEPMPVPD